MCLPSNTTKSYVSGKTCYNTVLNIENRTFEFSYLVNGSTIDTYVINPDIRGLGRCHELHHYNDGRICTGDNDLKQAHGNSILWAGVYNQYIRTGNSSCFRIFDR